MSDHGPTPQTALGRRIVDFIESYRTAIITATLNAVEHNDWPIVQAFAYQDSEMPNDEQCARIQELRELVQRARGRERGGR